MTINLKHVLSYLSVLLKWLIISLIVGVAGGIVGSLFHISIDYVTELRLRHPSLIFLLPVVGVLIATLYSIFAKNEAIDTNRVLTAARDDKKIPFVMAPLIFASSVITHLAGGSAGREGAALQLGGSIGYNIGRLFRLSKGDLHLIVMSGMSAVFSALFGTPVTAAFFAIEVTTVGIMHYTAIVPCVISSVAAYKLALFCGITPVSFSVPSPESLTALLLAQVIVLAILCALLSILFCFTIGKTEKLFVKLFKNKFIIGAAGGAILILLTLAVRTYDYNGAGIEVIARAMEGEANFEAAFLKIIFTAVTIAAGFKGGEIVPTFFIGSTFGCFVGGLLGISPAFGAAIGFVSTFCGVVNCPVASVILAMEIFGGVSLPLFAVSVAVAYLLSGNFSLYKSQQILYSKLDEHPLERL